MADCNIVEKLLLVAMMMMIMLEVLICKNDVWVMTLIISTAGALVVVVV